MIEISRTAFSAAIEAGIAAQENLTHDERLALRLVAAEAPAVGRVFSQCFAGDPCCPARQAGLDDDRTVAFQNAYDGAIIKSLRSQGGFQALTYEPARIK